MLKFSNTWDEIVKSSVKINFTSIHFLILYLKNYTFEQGFFLYRYLKFTVYEKMLYIVAKPLI